MSDQDLPSDDEMDDIPPFASRIRLHWNTTVPCQPNITFGPVLNGNMNVRCVLYWKTVAWMGSVKHGHNGRPALMVHWGYGDKVRK
jgi:hypothetical protein